MIDTIYAKWERMFDFIDVAKKSNKIEAKYVPTKFSWKEFILWQGPEQFQNDGRGRNKNWNEVR